MRNTRSKQLRFFSTVNVFVVIVLSLLFGCAPNAPDNTDFDKAAAISNDVNADNLMPWIEILAEVRASDTPVDCAGFAPEDLFPACNLTRDASVKVVSDGFKSMGYTPDTVALGEEPLVAYNIVAEWPGMAYPEEVVLVGSHLDAFYAGADDNGSAVAAMLEAARVIRQHQFARTIRFVSFDLEEYGAIGSTRYVEAGYAKDVVAAMVMDLIGYASDEPNSQDDVFGVTLPDVGDFLLVIGNHDSKEMTQQAVALSNTNDLAYLLGVIAPGDGTYFLSSVFMRSDHGLFWYNGIPAIFFTDTANFRNPNYHTPSDTPDTIDAEFLAQNTRAIVAVIALFAEVQS